MRGAPNGTAGGRGGRQRRSEVCRMSQCSPSPAGTSVSTTALGGAAATAVAATPAVRLTCRWADVRTVACTVSSPPAPGVDSTSLIAKLSPSSRTPACRNRASRAASARRSNASARPCARRTSATSTASSGGIGAPDDGAPGASSAAEPAADGTASDGSASDGWATAPMVGTVEGTVEGIVEGIVDGWTEDWTDGWSGEAADVWVRGPDRLPPAQAHQPPTPATTTANATGHTSQDAPRSGSAARRERRLSPGARRSVAAPRSADARDAVAARDALAARDGTRSTLVGVTATADVTGDPGPLEAVAAT